MFETKTRARNLSHGAKITALLLGELIFLSGFGLFICLLCAVMVLAYSPKTVFAGFVFEPYLPQGALWRGVVFFLFLGFAFLFLLFEKSFKFSYKAYFYHLEDHHTPGAAAFLSLKAGMRILACDTLLFLREALLFALFSLPAALTAGAVLLALRGRGITRELFIFGIALSVFQRLAGATVSFIFTRRYALTHFLLFLNPLISPAEAISSSVLLTRGRLLPITKLSVVSFPWIASCVFILPIPFAMAYTSLIKSVTYRQIYNA